MKRQKIVSLDEYTAPIAVEMKNFSKFVRDSLHAHATSVSGGDLYALQQTWKQAAEFIARAFADYVNEHEGEKIADPEQIVAKALQQRRITEWVE